MELLNSVIMTVLRMATPILLAGLGLVVSERAGILNIGTEGVMLTGALFGAIGSWAGKSIWIGVLCAVVGSVAVNLIIAFFSITLKADQTVVGTAINILAGGLTVTVNRSVFGIGTDNADIPLFQKIEIPVIKNIPIIGAIFSNQTILVYIALISVPIVSAVLYKTNVGLKIRSVGENPRACDTLGISVDRVRYSTMFFSGIMSGLAGIYISLSQMSSFTEGMVAGRGFIAVAAVVFGNYTPKGVFIAALVFGMADSLKYRMQASSYHVPYQFWLMVPYIITIFALCLYRKNSNKPACSAKPYIR